MNLRKNLWAKVAAVVASVMALGATLGLVHRNPPASGAIAATTADSGSAASPSQPFAAPSSPSQTSTARTARTHTRTHAS